MAELTDVASNTDMVNIANAIRAITRSEGTMTITQMPTRLTQIRVVEWGAVTCSFASGNSVSLGTFSTLINHMFLVMPKTTADAQKLSQVNPEASLVYSSTTGALSLSFGRAQNITIDFIVLDLLISATGTTTVGELILGAGVGSGGLEAYSTTRSYVFGEMFTYDSKLGYTKVAHGAEAYNAAHNEIIASKSYVDTALEGKVDKVTGKGLSTNDYDATEKAAVTANTAARHSHSNKAILDAITAAPQVQLVSGTNIKTVNGSSLLDAGNLEVGTVRSSSSEAGTAATLNADTVGGYTAQGIITNAQAGMGTVRTGEGVPTDPLYLGGDALSFSQSNPKLIEVSSGTNIAVEANPVLGGTEAALTGLKVGSTKYKVKVDSGMVASSGATSGQVLTANGTGGASWQNPSGGHLYWHSIQFHIRHDIGPSMDTVGTAVILSTLSTSYTYESFRAFLQSNPTARIIVMEAHCVIGSVKTNKALFFNYDTSQSGSDIKVTYLEDSGITPYSTYGSLRNMSVYPFSDMVHQIL